MPPVTGMPVIRYACREYLGSSKAGHHPKAAAPDVLPIFLPRSDVSITTLCCSSQDLACSFGPYHSFVCSCSALCIVGYQILPSIMPHAHR